jgi:hypothetical protein
MATYEKLTVERFQENLQSGKYNSLTGARRAIGKTSSWSNKEKERASEIAVSHFGGDAGTASAPAKKAVKKVAAKKTVAAAKTAGAKRGPKAAKASPPKAAAKLGRPVGSTKAASMASESPARALRSEGRADMSPREAVLLGTELVTFASQLRDQVRGMKQDSPNSNLNEAIQEVNSILVRAGRLVNSRLPQDSAVEFPPARVAVGVQGTIAPVPSAGENGVALTDNERQIAESLRTAPQATSINSLPRPVQS